jgi:cyclophilin family peptidyl-prolyl cis-trans isomerase
MEQEQPKSKKTVYIVVGVILLVAAAYFIFDRKSGGPAAILQQNQPIAPSVQNQPDNSALTVGQTQIASSSQAAIKNNMHKITLETNYGTIEFTTYDADAPITVKKFIDLTNKGFYDNLTFHRVIDGFMIQGGDPLGNGTGGPGYTFADELNPGTDSYKAGYVKGTVAMANAGPNTNGSQFFIMVADYPLDHNYTIFGKVTNGQEVADKIAKVAKDSNDKPLTPVVMKKVTVSISQ